MNVRVVSRETVECVARVMGLNSAAAKALENADEHDGPVRFYQTRSSDGSRIIVEKLPKEAA